MQTYQVTYHGKPNKGASEHLPVPGIPVPFAPGETREFSEQYCLTLGIDPKNAKDWLTSTFDLLNANRPEDQQLFTVETVKEDKSSSKATTDKKD